MTEKQYSGKDNRNLEPSIDEIVTETVRLIQRKYLTVGSQMRRMDFAAIAQQITLDVITYLALGQPFGYIADDEDKYEYIKSIEDNFPLMNVFATLPVLSDIMRIPTIQNSLIPTTKDKTGLGKTKAYVQSFPTLTSRTKPAANNTQRRKRNHP